MGGVYPFGDASFLSGDLKYQYVDFFLWLKRAMTGQASLFYTSALSLGNNAWGIYSYYLGSPLNLLILFFDENRLTDFVILADAIKLGLIQLSMAWYLRRRFELPCPHAFALALCLTWCSWTFTDLCNPLWLDELYLLPLGMLGVWEYITEDKGGKLVTAVSLSVVCCWYMAYMGCLFIALYAFIELGALRDDHDKGILFWVRRLAGVIVRLVIGVLLSAWTFLPTILSFAGGSDGIKPSGFFTCPKTALVSSFFPGTLTVYRLPQLFSGTLVLVLGLLFLLDGRIRRRTRLVTLLVMLLVLASVGVSWVEYIWCGFRMPNGFFSRTSVFVTLGLIWMSGWELSLVCHKGVPRCQILPSALVVSLASLVPFARHYYQSDWWLLASLGGTVLSTLLVSLACPVDRKKGQNPLSAHTASGYLMVALCAVELALSACVVLPQIYGVNLYSQSAHDVYVVDAKEGFERLRQLDYGTWRMDKTYTRSGTAALNEGLALGYSGISSYCSSNNAAAVQFLNALGYSNPGEFSVRYASPIPVSDSLLGVKYAWTPQASPYGLEDTGLTSGVNGAKAYENPLALSLGYGASEEVLAEPLPGVDNATTADANPFEVQNQMVSIILGGDARPFKPVEPQLVATTDVSRTWSIEVPDNTQLYCYVVGGSRDVQLSIDGGSPIHEYSRFQHAIQQIGTAGGIHEVTLSSSPDSEGNQWALSDDSSCIFYELDDESLRECVAEIGSHQMEITSFSDGHVEGAYHADSDGLLLITVPYDSGWTIKVNGECITAREAFGGALMAIPVKKGESNIELSYVSPGFLPGCVISFVALGFVTFTRRRRAAVR
ncbi:MAG: YfhO family protein [Olegusella sp.]|nr:YfhO family protein [Olegusella sp.]